MKERSQETTEGKETPTARPGPGRPAPPARRPDRPSRRQPPTASSQSSASVPGLPGHAAPTALIADPDPDVLASTAMLVSTLGYEPIAVGEATDVLETIEAQRPGLVLVETQFPGLNLAGLVAALRSNPDTAGIPVAFFSASKDLAPAAARHQVWGTLAKPFTLRELGLLLARALGPSPHMVEAGLERNIERDVRAAFHDYRNLLTAIGNYVAILDKVADLPQPARMAVNRLSELTLKMESKTEHLRAYVLSLMLPFAGGEPEGPSRLPPQQPP